MVTVEAIFEIVEENAWQKWWGQLGALGIALARKKWLIKASQGVMEINGE